MCPACKHVDVNECHVLILLVMSSWRQDESLIHRIILVLWCFCFVTHDFLPVSVYISRLFHTFLLLEHFCCCWFLLLNSVFVLYSRIRINAETGEASKLWDADHLPQRHASQWITVSLSLLLSFWIHSKHKVEKRHGWIGDGIDRLI